MIAAQDIVNRCLAALDAEGSDRYIWDRDFIHAFNYANDKMIALFNSVFSANKLSEESLSEVMRMRCFQASTHSRVAFDSTIVGDTLWSVIGVYLNVTTIPISYTLPTATDESVYLSNVSFGSSARSCKRLTWEQWSERLRNPLVAGSSFITTPELSDPAYINFTDYTGGYTLANNNFEIEISPSVAGQLVSIAYNKLPVVPAIVTGNLEFPQSVAPLFTDFALNYIAFKQGDRPLLDITEFDANKLIKFMT